MKIISNINDEIFDVEINVHPDSEGRFDAVIDGRQASLEIIEGKPSSMTVSIDSRVYFFEYVKEEGRIRHVIHNNRTYRSILRNRQQEQLEVLLEQFGAGLGGGATETKLQAPMPGKILGISVKEGEKIKLGQVVLVLEAMKMENEISSNIEGTVKQIAYKVGDSVTAGDVLLEIEPPD